MWFFVLRWLTGSWEYLAVISIAAVVAYVIKEVCKADAKAKRRKVVRAAKRDCGVIADSLGQLRQAVVIGYSVPEDADADVEDNSDELDAAYLKGYIAQSRKRLNALLLRRDKLLALDTNKDSRTWKSNAYDIDYTKNEIEKSQAMLKEITHK